MATQATFPALRYQRLAAVAVALPDAPERELNEILADAWEIEMGRPLSR